MGYPYDLIIAREFRISPIHPPLGHLDPFNWYQRIRHSTPQAHAQPSRRPDVPESAAQQDEIIRGIVATKEEQLEAQQEMTKSSDSSDDDY